MGFAKLRNAFAPANQAIFGFDTGQCNVALNAFVMWFRIGQGESLDLANFHLFSLNLLSPVTLDTAVEFLSLPDRIRGYGPVKEKAVKDAKARYTQLAADLATPPPAPRQIAAE